MNGIALPLESEQFAAEAIASGRFRDMDEVIRTGVELVRRRETARAEFIASLEAAQEEDEHNGFFTIEEVGRDMDAAIAEVVAKTVRR